jgi:hypothetical protein
MTVDTDKTHNRDRAGGPRYVRWIRGIWLAGTAVSVLAAFAAAVGEAEVVTWVLLAITLVQAGCAVPAALALARGRKWAWWVLFVLAVLSLGSLASALRLQAWPSVILNLVLGATVGLLQDNAVRVFVGKTHRGRQRH